MRHTFSDAGATVWRATAGAKQALNVYPTHTVYTLVLFLVRYGFIKLPYVDILVGSCGSQTVDNRLLVQ